MKKCVIPAITPLASPGIPSIFVTLLWVKYSSHPVFSFDELQNRDQRSVVFSTTNGVKEGASVPLKLSLMLILILFSFWIVLAHRSSWSSCREMLRLPSIHTLVADKMNREQKWLLWTKITLRQTVKHENVFKINICIALKGDCVSFAYNLGMEIKQTNP